MKLYHPLLVLIASLFCCQLQAAPFYYFEHYTTREGLPSNTIHCTYQDRFGFVWIGTRDGLTRFDGYDFRSPYEPGADQMTNMACMDIGEDEEGMIWFAASEGVGWYNPYTGITGSLGRLGVSPAFDLQPDMKGNVWVAGDKIYRYIKEDGQIREYAFPASSPSRIAVDSYDAVWVILANGSLYSYDKRRDRFDPANFPYRLADIQPAEEGRILASTRDGQVLLIETINMTVTPIFEAGSLEIRQILERKPGEYWIGTDNGLFVKFLREDELAEIRNNADPHSISADYITSLAKDKAGNVWVGTYYNGLNIWQDKQDEFFIYYPNPLHERSMIGSIVRSIAADEEGGIWFCTEDGGLNRLSPNRRGGEAFEIEPKLNLQGLVMSGDSLWVYTFGKGVWHYDPIKRTPVKHYDVSRSSGCGLRTSDGQILAGSLSGLYYYDPEQDKFVRDETFRGGYVHSLFQDSRGNLWIGTYGNGLFCRDSGGNGLSHLNVSSDRGLTANRITSFFEDSRHRIWITTEGGGVCYTEPMPNLSNLRVNAITRAEGLASNVTCAVVEDESGILWVSSTRGIIRIDGETAQIRDYLFDRQQIMGSQFSYGAALTTRNGLIYMGNTNGLVAFSPAKMKKTMLQHPLYITNIEASAAGHTMRLHEPEHSAINSNGLRVRSRDAALLSISYAAPNYSILQHITYEYALYRGGNRPLLSARTAENSVHFTGLRPGHYRFEVSILGADSPNARRTLEFDVLAPFLWSSAAKVIYCLFLLAMLCVFFYELEMKRRRDRARHITRLENEKQKEIYDAKINFFTNITHEIRTPLTLIKMPLDKLIASGEYTPKAEKDMLTIQANADRLLSLTNQLLDLRKMEKNEIKPVFLKNDLAALVRTTCAHFEQMATEQKIALFVDVPPGSYEIMCVRDSVEKIVGNLLSNAVKYTQDRIDVSLKPSDDGKTAILRVNSNGPLIPPRESEKIFEIFYQMGDPEHQSKGTGLGLAYARTLAGLHGGKLYLDLNVRDCNSFVLELPVEQQAPIQMQAARETAPAEETLGADHDSSRHTLLIVEDSSEMRGYLARELSDEYNIVTAPNGQDAVEKLQSDKIDLVVSDIMMPLMDGCQLCNYIKTNMEFSHLPVLLLTAAVGMETRLQTLEVGADGYIEKPFPIELLRANIASLFKNRDIAYKQFTDSPLTHFNSVNTSKMDEEFMEKLHGIVMKHMAEQDLSIETLTNLIGTSKSTLYRKVKANTGLNINEYIRLCRLKQAAEMLSSQKYRINEVAYMVGFSSPSYFATSFQKQFNISPSSFVKNLKD